MINFKINAGHRFGKLVCIKPVGKYKTGNSVWLCKCDCGKRSNILLASLRDGRQTSCGCSQYKNAGLNKIHGLSKHPLYRIWVGIKKRCYYEKCDKFKYYGGKGIKVCNQWKNNFNNFYNWAISNGWESGLTIERKKSNKNYCPSNCKWATMLEQANNKSNNIKILYNGVLSTLSTISKISGLKKTTISARISKGWPIEKAISLPKCTRLKYS